MNNESTNKLEELIEAIRASKKYAAISEDLIRAIGARELAARRNPKEAIKATKNKLHQVAGVFLDARPPYEKWLAVLESVGTLERSNVQTFNVFQEACRQLMYHHASTRERISILEPFYRQVFAALPPVRSVLDLACGLNPLAIPWMPLPPGATYFACDLYEDMVGFLNGFFRLAGVDGRASVCDLVSGPPRQRADLALVLKTLPTLDQIARDAGRDLLRALDVPYMLVSFPARSLGGRDKRMPEHYAERFAALVAAEGWSAERFEFATELAFLVRK